MPHFNIIETQKRAKDNEVNENDKLAKKFFYLFTTCQIRNEWVQMPKLLVLQIKNDAFLKVSEEIHIRYAYFNINRMHLLVTVT